MAGGGNYFQEQDAIVCCFQMCSFIATCTCKLVHMFLKAAVKVGVELVGVKKYKEYKNAITGRDE